MREHLSGIVIVLLAASVVAGCGRRRFEEARLDEPHAIVKVRVVYHAMEGPQLDQDVLWNELAVGMPPLTPERQRLRVLRVRPEPAFWRFRSVFFHTETRTEMRTDYVTEQYACGTYTSGTGTYRSTQTRYCTRQVPRHRWVPVTRRYDHGSCAARVALTPLVGAVYLVQYEYLANGACSARCYRQLPGERPGEELRMLPCGAGEPPVGPTSGSEDVQLLQSVPPAPTTYGQ